MDFYITTDLLATFLHDNQLKSGQYLIMMSFNENKDAKKVPVAECQYECTSTGNGVLPIVKLKILKPTFKQSDIILNVINGYFTIEQYPLTNVYYFDADPYEKTKITLFSCKLFDIDSFQRNDMKLIKNYFLSTDYDKDTLEKDFNQHIVNNLVNLLNTFNPKKKAKNQHENN